jgi:hypothetical protein
MSAAQPGILAIFNDCRAGREDEFNAWFQGEHLQERLAVPGFSIRPPASGDFRERRLFQLLSCRIS